MSISNQECPNRFCDFCDTEEDVLKFYHVEDKLNEGRVPGYFDESN